IYVIAALYISFVFFTAALASRWLYKPVYLIVFAFIVFTEYGYSKALERFTSFYDIVSAISATPQQRVESISAFFNPVALVPLIIFVALCIFLRSTRKPFRFARLLFVLIAIVLFYVHFYYVIKMLFYL